MAGMNGLNFGLCGVKTRDDYGAAKKLGAQCVRLFVDGCTAETVRKEIALASAFGLDMMLTIGGACSPKRWADIVHECKGSVRWWDIENEPQDDGWPQRARETYDWLRCADPSAEVVVESDARWILEGSERHCRGLGFGLHSIHFYEPIAITHQHVNPSWTQTWSYPTGPDPREHWNRDRLRSMLAAVCKSGTIVGEFGCSRAAPAGTPEAWLTDVLSLFVELGVAGWIYEDWRGDPCWSAELPSGTPIERLRSGEIRPGRTPTTELLRAAFKTRRHV